MEKNVHDVLRSKKKKNCIPQKNVYLVYYFMCVYKYTCIFIYT